MVKNAQAHVFFQKLNQDLRHSAFGLPRLILDADQLERNLTYAKQQLNQDKHLKPRLVVKSLASLQLLQTVAAHFQTQRFMVFHLPQILPILENFSSADVLMGKPMPASAIEYFYLRFSSWNTANIQWLVDTPQRLTAYLDIARRYAVQLKINIEIDVGLHRGGVSNEHDLIGLMNIIKAHPEQLKFSGLMGYDAHITKLPSVIKKAEVAFAESQQIYQYFIEIIQAQFPQLWHEELCLNGGGSPSFNFHVKQSVCNDLSFGSMLLKPSDFDSTYLEALKPALWIASPVLKVLESTELPGMTLLNKLPHKNKALFIYGGYWMAEYVYPEGAHPHLLYGRSSNQELVNVSKMTQIDVDDYVFLRPTQSEVIIPQFAELYYYKNSAFEVWETFRE